MKQPWICPRCASVNAPHVDSCGCSPVSGGKQPEVEAPKQIPFDLGRVGLKKKAADQDKTAADETRKYKVARWVTCEYQPCAYDGLPPGVYFLSCSCPKCSIRFGTGSILTTTTSTQSSSDMIFRVN